MVAPYCPEDISTGAVSPRMRLGVSLSTSKLILTATFDPFGHDRGVSFRPALAVETARLASSTVHLVPGTGVLFCPADVVTTIAVVSPTNRAIRRIQASSAVFNVRYNAASVRTGVRFAAARPVCVSFGALQVKQQRLMRMAFCRLALHSIVTMVSFRVIRHRTAG